MATFENGEWIWRPLQNPKSLTVNVFDAPNIRGMGLMQRDTDYDNYLDLEAKYEARPSAWIEPKGDWGPGKLHLVQIPSPEEIHDNIVTFWTPQNNFELLQPIAFDYKLRWAPPKRIASPEGQVVFTRTGKGKRTTPGCSSWNFKAANLTICPTTRPWTPTFGLEWEESSWRNAFTRIPSTATGGWCSK